MVTTPSAPIPEAMVGIVARAIFREGYVGWERSQEYARAALRDIDDSGSVILPAEPTMKMVTAAALLAPEAGVGLCGAIYRAMRDAAGGKESE